MKAKDEKGNTLFLFTGIDKASIELIITVTPNTIKYKVEQ